MLRMAHVRKLVVAVVLASALSVNAEDIGWPRSFEADGHAVVVYQPQVEEWKDYGKLRFLMAVSVLKAGEGDRTYGVIELSADTKVNHEERSVLLTQLLLTTRFPDIDAASAIELDGIVRTALPDKETLVVDLDRLIAGIQMSKVQDREIEINLDPPPIFYSDKPAVLVMFMGDPNFKPVKGTGLLFAVNTNWDVFLEAGNSQYYLRVGEGWLVSSDPKSGTWQPATTLPEGLSKLPDDEDWAEVRKHVPGKALVKAPRVFVSTQPAELVLTDGAPELGPIPGTDLHYYTNTESDLFFRIKDGQQYLLVAGRWFRAKTLDGPWEAATLELPESFALIPDDHPKASVLASVPGTPEAKEAITQALIPRKATVTRSKTTVIVVYEGEPTFKIIKGSKNVYYATNTTYSVVRVDTKHYCCENGIWFESAQPMGPWVVCGSVPAAVYTIPATSPYHNVTYVYVYDTTPDTVVVGYTAGYTGAYVANGLLVFGAGYWLGHELAHDDHWHAWRYPPCYYSYGCAARYSYHHGAYARGAVRYGPYGGAGYGARYNPVTGTYARGARAYGPHGSAGVVRAYNPRTGTMARGAYVSGPRGTVARGGIYNPRTGRGAASYQSRSPYGSWGRSVVSDGRNWDRFGHRSGPGGTTAGIETSRGAKGAVNRSGHGWNYAGKTASGDLYAGQNGKVYRREKDNNWSSRSNAGRKWNKSEQVGERRTSGSDASSGRTRGQTDAGARSSRQTRTPSRTANTSRSSQGSQNRLNRDSRSRGRGNKLSSRSRSMRGSGRAAPRSRGGRRR